jgi:hypothetical protein
MSIFVKTMPIQADGLENAEEWGITYQRSSRRKSCGKHMTRRTLDIFVSESYKVGRTTIDRNLMLISTIFTNAAMNLLVW